MFRGRDWKEAHYRLSIRKKIIKMKTFGKYMTFNKIQRKNQNQKRTSSCSPEKPYSISLCVNNGELFPIKCFDVIFLDCILKVLFLG